ncbi:MAG TPA: ATPase [Sphingomicrobium sp.]|jgi:F-type H+-transporting ATPase subunit b|nr:ATPase [Sphingomicrobium sp.]
MPQLYQLPTVVWSQFLWLAVALGFIFFVIAKGMVPKIQATVEGREQKISADLEAAQKAREEAEATEGDYRKQMDASRAEAMKLAQAAKQEGAREAEERTRAIDAEIGDKIAKAEADIRKSLEEAKSELDSMAVEATREMYAKLTGKAVPAADATRAVRTVLNG